ncbi:MAG: hypothetical protein KFB96_07770 [Thiocapsa sp.]|uniref:carboxylate--amine ligase n=1 Tax=Thiocapsa sp. TaxID=2024551 RepID=UPI001BCFFB41|nr:hypothetical protein [Thiocapsa sp.]QVL50323.1 MAG: hypothetical protein KFB96_07770 [Thiocapsa sp.]
MKETMSAVPAVVLGGGVNGLGVIRSLGRHGIPVTLINRNRQDIATRSRYMTTFIKAPDDPKELIDCLLDLAARCHERQALFYTSDIFLEIVSQYRDRLADHYRFIISDEKSVGIVLGKDAFDRFTAEQGLPAPRGVEVTAETSISELEDRLTYPLVVKPQLSFEWRVARFVDEFGSVKVIRCDTPDEMRDLLPRLRQHTSRLLVQEAILGEDDAHYSFYSYRSPRFGEIVCLCVNKERIWPIHNGVGSFARVVTNAEMCEIGTRLLNTLGWVGVASICFKVERRTGRPMIHEVNGRLPQLHGVFQAAGVDLPYLMYLDALDVPLPKMPDRPRSVTYRILSIDGPALLAYRRDGQLSRLQVLMKALRVDATAEFGRDDWKPALMALREAVPSFLRGLL